MNDRYTSGEYLAANPNWHEGDSLWKAQLIHRMLKQNNLSPKSVCEIGCGTGRVLSSLQQLREDGVQFDGFDISPQAIERARTRENAFLRFHCDDVLAQTEKNFELVLLIDVIEHLEDYLGFLRKIKPMSSLKILHIPLDLSVQSVARMKPILEQRSVVGHIHYFTKETALASLEDAGYEIVDLFYTGAAIDLPAWSLKSRLARMPRRLLFALNQDLAARWFGGFSLMVLVK